MPPQYGASQMTDTTAGRKSVRRSTSPLPATTDGEQRVIAKISQAPAKPVTASEQKRASAAAPSMMRSKSEVGGYGDSRRVVSSIESSIASDIIGHDATPNPLLRHYPDSVTEGKHLRSTAADGRIREAKQVQAAATFSTALSQFGIAPEFDNYDMLDMMAQHLVQLLQGNIYSYANLSKYERNLLFRYFHKYNPVIARIVDLHTDLPLSKTRLQPPQGVPEIVRDYVGQFYDRIFARLNLNDIMRDMVVSYYVYGEAYVQVDDDFAREADRILQDIGHLAEKVYEHSPEDLKFLQEVELKYQTLPTSVSLKERDKYVKTKFANFYDQDYQGPNKLQVLKFYNVMEYLENPDIDFEALRYTTSESLKRLHEMGLDRQALTDLGYSEGFLDLVGQGGSNESYVIDNDIYSGMPFLFSFRRTDSNSVLTRLISEMCEWDAAQRSIRAKIENLGKLGRIVTAEGISEAQVAQLQAEVTEMLQNPNHAVVANYPITWDEVNSFIKEELNELIERLDVIKVSLAMGAGIPDSLLAGDGAYSGDNIKLDLLNTYYLGFNQRLQNTIEEKLLKPIAMRKGFVSIDEWGYPTLIYPKMTFSRLGLRDSGILETLFQLYQKGSLPLEIILDVLNLDPEHVRRGIEKDFGTHMDVNMNGLIQEMYVQAAADIYQDTTLKEKLEQALKLNKRPGGGVSTSPQMEDAENTDDKQDTESHQPKDKTIQPKEKDDKGPLEKNTHGIQAALMYAMRGRQASPLNTRVRETGEGQFQHKDPDHAPRHDLRKRKTMPDTDLDSGDPDLSMGDKDIGGDRDLSVSDSDLGK